MEQKRIKILYLITQSIIGGAQKYVFDLATNLNKEKCEKAVAAGGDGELFKQLEIAGIKIFKLKWLGRPIGFIRDTLAYFEIKKLLKEWQPNILHLNSSKAAVLGSLAARNLPIKVIYTVHGAVFEASFSWLARKLFLRLEKWTAKYKHKIICVSENDRKLWLKYKVAPSEKLIVIHNGIDYQNLAKNFLTKEKGLEILASQKPALSEALKASSNLKIIGTIANFYPEKGLSYLIRALDIVFKKFPNAIFIHLGYGPQKRLIEKMLKDYHLEKKIFLMGMPEEIGPKYEAFRYLKVFDIFVLSSIKEGFPYVILEAMAAGLPIVATRVGGVPKMINPPQPPFIKGGVGGIYSLFKKGGVGITPPFLKGGDGGILVEPKNSQEMAEKIIYLLNNPEIAKDLGQGAQDKVREEFTLEKMVQETEKIYS